MTAPNLDAQRLRILLAGMCSIMLCVGIARFGLTPLMPILQGQTFLNDATGGWLATTNYIGYMTGAIITMYLVRLDIKDQLYRACLVLAVLSTIAMVISEDLILWSLFRYLSGLAATGAILIASGLIMNWLMRHNFRTELGIHFLGVGLGIVLVALTVEAMYRMTWTWEMHWTGLAALGALLAIPAWFWMPRPDTVTTGTPNEHLKDTPPATKFLWVLHLSYFCAGYGFAVMSTFIVSLIESLPDMAGAGNWIFVVVGLSATFGVLFWDFAARRFGTFNALIACYGLKTVGILLPVLSPYLSEAILGGILYGATFPGCVSLVLMMAGKFYPSKPAKLMAIATLSYGAAQITAPFLTGLMAEHMGYYDTGVLIAAGFVGAGGILTIWLKALAPPKIDL